jgi:general secretion pathway protein F
MAVFEYRALNAKGRKVSGIVDADSLPVAREKLRAGQLFPVTLSQLSERGDKTGGSRFGLDRIPVISGITSPEVAMVTRLLATLLSAGFPLVRAVGTVAGQTRSRALQKVLSRVKDAVEEGSSFADAMAPFPQVFSPVYVNMVAAGESSGTLEIVLERLADVTEKKEQTRKKIQASLAYPLIMTLIGCLVLVILLTYIVPGIIQIFSDMNQTLPLPTLILIRVSDFFVMFWWALLLLPFLAGAGVYALRKKPKGRLVIDRMLISLPVAGGLIRKLVTARFARTLGSLLENGVPMLTSLKISRSIANNQVVSDLIESAADRVEQGQELGAILAESPYFPKLAAQMIQVGEKSGEMEKMLAKTADLYERDVQAAVTAATALIEPLIILVMGVVVGLIIMAVCLPIVEINTLLGVGS